MVLVEAGLPAGAPGGHQAEAPDLLWCGRAFLREGLRWRGPVGTGGPLPRVTVNSLVTRRLLRAPLGRWRAQGTRQPVPPRPVTPTTEPATQPPSLQGQHRPSHGVSMSQHVTPHGALCH